MGTTQKPDLRAETFRRIRDKMFANDIGSGPWFTKGKLRGSLADRLNNCSYFSSKSLYALMSFQIKRIEAPDACKTIYGLLKMEECFEHS